MSYRGKVGLGITTFKRPELFRECRDSVIEHLGGVADEIIVCQDGGDSYIGDCPDDWQTIERRWNKGWAYSKNACLDWLIHAGCEHLFMVEDDVLITSPQAITGYIDAARSRRLPYLTAHPWGEATTRQVQVDGPVTYWAYVGSWWTYFTRELWFNHGGYNTTLGNTMGDIEIYERWRVTGLPVGWGRLPDATGSESWVTPRCLLPKDSTIATDPAWNDQQAFALRWWMAELDTPVPPEIRPAREKSGNCLRA